MIGGQATEPAMAVQPISGGKQPAIPPQTMFCEVRRFSAIVVTGAVDTIPQRFLDWLQPDGRMVVVRGRSPAMEAVRVRNEHGVQRIESLFETDLPYLVGAAPAPAFEF